MQLYAAEEAEEGSQNNVEWRIDTVE